MLLPEAFPLDTNDLSFIDLSAFEISLKGGTPPPFSNPATFTDYAPDEITLMPVLYERRSPKWYDGDRADPIIHELLLFFDDDEYDVSEYGPLWGDKNLEARIQGHMSKIFPSSIFGSPEFTSMMEQGEDYISLRYPVGDGFALSRALRANPDVYSNMQTSALVQDVMIVRPLMAERYYQSVSSTTDESIRPNTPCGMAAGLRTSRKLQMENS